MSCAMALKFTLDMAELKAMAMITSVKVAKSLTITLPCNFVPLFGS